MDDDNQPNMTLNEFFDHVRDVQTSMLARGIVTVYFMHDTLTPYTVRGTWEDFPVADVPKVGTVLDLPGLGLFGADARWRVVRVEWAAGPGVTLFMTDADA